MPVIAEEFKQSLKMTEAEEPLDLFFYRPIAFVLVKAVYRLPITPNQVTLLSGLFGLAAGWCFSRGSSLLGAAAACYALANILDCSDGQLARLQGSGTQFGRVIDGVTDYIASVAIFAGIGVGLSAAGDPAWLLVIAAGISSAVHALFFDHHQNEFITIARGERHSLSREREKYEAILQTSEHSPRNFLTRSFLRLYVGYLQIQQRVYRAGNERESDPDAYRRRNRTMIRLWSVLGPTTNRSVLIVCALAGRPDIYLWTVLTAGNLWLLFCTLLQRHMYPRPHQKL